MKRCAYCSSTLLQIEEDGAISCLLCSRALTAAPRVVPLVVPPSPGLKPCAECGFAQAADEYAWVDRRHHERGRQAICKTCRLLARPSVRKVAS